MIKKKLKLLLMTLIVVFITGCSDTTTTINSPSKEEKTDKVSLTYVADFYDNYGGRWLSVEGKEFSISPNKIKTYSWDSEGSWISSYEMASVMSVNIDGNQIESCGSTVIFSDSRLEKCDIDFDDEVSTTQAKENYKENSSISQPKGIRYEDYWKIQRWWNQKNLNNQGFDSRIVIIQSQLGNPICMYSGNDVSWDIPKNLPKTTMVTIDGKVIYIHRANFSIVDTSLLGD